MKKLFCTALVAIVALGGALTSHAQEARGANRVYGCSNGTQTLCSGIPETTVDILPSGPKGVDPAEFFAGAIEKYDL